MGRSYSEYPFHEQQPMLGVQGSGPRLGNDEDQQKLGQQKPTLPDTGLNFRQPHAETIKRYQRRAARRAAGGSGARQGATAKKAPTAKKAAAKKAPAAAKKASPAKAAPVAKKPMTTRASPLTKAAPEAKATPAAKPGTGRLGVVARVGAVAKVPARGSKTLVRAAAAAKTIVQRVAKKVTARKTPKKR